MKLVPKRRFACFTGNWEVVELGNIVSIKSGRSPSLFNDGGILYVKVDDLNDSTREQNSSQIKVSENVKATKVSKGSIIFPKRGAAIMTNKVRIMGDSGYMDTNMMALEVIGVDGNFLYSFICATGLYKMADTSTIPQINNKHIEPYMIKTPNAEEQQEIGSFFKKLDDKIVIQRDKLNKLQAMKQAYLHEMFPAEGESVPKRRFAGFTKDWRESKVKDMFTITRGNVLAVNKTVSRKTETMPYPVYSSQTKDKGLMGYYNDFLYQNAITWTTDGANAGTVNYREGKFYCTNVCGVLISNEGLANEMVSEALNRVTWKHVSKVGNPKLMNNVMGEIVILLPEEIEEQKVISRFIRNVDQMIAFQQQKLKKLEAMKKAYLEEMFV